MTDTEEADYCRGFRAPVLPQLVCIVRVAASVTTESDPHRVAQVGHLCQSRQPTPRITSS